MENNDDLVLVVKDVIEGFQSLRRRVENERYSPSIYKVPNTLRDLSPTSFYPQVVSIGPIHRNDAKVQAFEAQKVLYLDLLLERVISKKRNQRPLEDCVQKVANSIDQIRAHYYEETVNNYDNSELTQMMVLDACFILEFVNHLGEPQNMFPASQNMVQSVTYDLVLLENQIPFFVLNDVFQCTMHHLEPDTHLIEFISPILKALNIFQTKLKLTSIHTDNHDHILAILHTCYKPQVYKDGLDFLSSATLSIVELDRAGVNFKPNRDAKWPMAMDVKLHRIPCCSCSWRKPTFRIPVLCINRFTDLVLRNLIAYEQSYSSQISHHITSYAFAMGTLIYSQEDVAKLVASKVLVNHIGSNEDAAYMINSIGKEIGKVDFFYAEQWKDLDRHCNGCWPSIRRIYFSNPWNIVNLVAGMVLFVLTMVQTYFTVMSA